MSDGFVVSSPKKLISFVGGNVVLGLSYGKTDGTESKTRLDGSRK